MDDTKRDFEQRLNAIKEETGNAMKKLCCKYNNMKNWKVQFDFDWSVTNRSFIDEEWNDIGTNDVKGEQDV